MSGWTALQRARATKKRREEKGTTVHGRQSTNDCLARVRQGSSRSCITRSRNSRLAGSDNLDRWSHTATEAILGAYRDHVVAPLLTVRDEFFNTFRRRPSIVSEREFETDKESLIRMLAGE